MTPDVNVFIINFPRPGNEMVVRNEDDTYTIFINARLSNDGQLRAYQHAMKHIREEDFNKTNVQEIEALAHDMVSANSEALPAAKYEERLKWLQKQRKKTQKTMKRYEKKLKFLQENGMDDFFESLERSYLYGDDL